MCILRKGAATDTQAQGRVQDAAFAHSSLGGRKSRLSGACACYVGGVLGGLA